MSKRRRLEPIRLEDLENNPCASGLESVLRFSTPPPSSGAPGLGAPELAKDPPFTPSSKIGAPILSAPTVTAPELASDESIYTHRATHPAIREATSAQDGHTHGEQALFETLWRLAKPAGQGLTRALSVGERTLAAEVPMAYSTVQENLRSLARKLAIEIKPAGPNRPKIYIVFSYDDILRRRRSAGLTHVLRRTSGVTLITAAGDPLSSGALSVGAPNPGAPEEAIERPEARGRDTESAPS
jgi:hypothetical protein